MTNTSGVVGMVHINCPACGELIEADVRVSTVEHHGGAYVTVEYQTERPDHRCVGRRS